MRTIKLFVNCKSKRITMYRNFVIFRPQQSFLDEGFIKKIYF